MLLRLDAKKSYERQFFIKLEKPYLWSILGPFGLKNSEHVFPNSSVLPYCRLSDTFEIGKTEKLTNREKDTQIKG